MSKTRLEAFSDAVIAIIITIMVLDLHPPTGTTWSALNSEDSVFATYVLSFLYLGIYWNNHHHMLYATRRVNGSALWANLHLLFWLSLIPFTTGWMGRTHFAAAPTALYGIDLLMAAIAYWLLERALIAAQGGRSVLEEAVGAEIKGLVSPAIYVVAIAVSFYAQVISAALYVIVALMWLLPDRRIERIIMREKDGPPRDEARENRGGL